MMEGIGPRIKALREKRGYSLRELGNRINISHSHIQRIEKGKKTPNIELLQTLSELFDVPMAYFFGEVYEVPDKYKGKIDWVFIKDKHRGSITQEQLEETLENFMKNLGDKE